MIRLGKSFYGPANIASEISLSESNQDEIVAESFYMHRSTGVSAGLIGITGTVLLLVTEWCFAGLAIDGIGLVSGTA